MARAGLMVRRRRISVSSSSDTPSSARYSHWIGTRTESLAARAFRVSKSRAGGQSIRTYAYFSRMLEMAAFRRYSRFSMLTSSTAAPTRFLSEGRRSSPSTWASRTILSIGSSRIKVWYSVRLAGSFGNPSALVVFPWGSQSIIKVLCSEAAREAPRLTAVVVFPTPPF